MEDLNSFSADLIVDVRTAEEQSISMIPGAVAVRPDADLSWLSEFANARRIVVYCAAGYRSARAIAALPSDRRGAREIYSLRGGIISYANAGRPLAGTSEQKVHGYNAAWAVFVRAPARAVLEPVPGGRP